MQLLPSGFPLHAALCTFHLTTLDLDQLLKYFRRHEPLFLDLIGKWRLGHLSETWQESNCCTWQDLDLGWGFSTEGINSISGGHPEFGLSRAADCSTGPAGLTRVRPLPEHIGRDSTLRLSTGLGPLVGVQRKQLQTSQNLRMLSRVNAFLCCIFPARFLKCLCW